MAYAALASVNVGDFGKASQWNQNKANWDHVVDDATDKIETDLVVQDSITDDAVGQDQLKIASEAESVAGTPPANTRFTWSSVSAYGFYPSHYYTTTGDRTLGYNLRIVNAAVSSTSAIVTAYLSDAAIIAGATGTLAAFVNIAYVQASPPYPFGDLIMGDGYPWLVVLRDDKGEIVRGWEAEDPWWDLASRGRWPKGHPAAIIARPHPFVDDVPEIPPDWSIELIDLRCEMEEEDDTPAADELARLEAALPEHIAAGIPPAELQRWIDEARDRATAEAADQAAARVALDRIPLETEWRIQDALRSRQLSQPQKAERISRLRMGERAKSFELRRKSGRMPRIELRRKQQKALGRTALALVHLDQWPAATNATHCLSDDTKHPDRKHLPQIPGLFIPSTDGTPPRVRVMTQA